jgi:hypothetical protein
MMKPTLRAVDFVLLVTTLSVVLACDVRAGETVSIGFADWKYRNDKGAPGDPVPADGIVLKQYQMAIYTGPMLDICEVTFSLDWLNVNAQYGMSVGLLVSYDDWMPERHRLEMKPGEKTKVLTCVLNRAAERRVKGLELLHGVSGPVVKVAAIEAKTQKRAASFASSILGTARLTDTGSIFNDILIARGGADMKDLPRLEGLNQTEITFLASISSIHDAFLERELTLLAMDSKGNQIKSFKAKLTGIPRVVSLALPKEILDKAAFWIIFGAGNSVHVAIRRIIVGPMPAGEKPPLTLKDLNDRLLALVEKWKAEKGVPAEIPSELEKLLAEYRKFER